MFISQLSRAAAAQVISFGPTDMCQSTVSAIQNGSELLIPHAHQLASTSLLKQIIFDAFWVKICT